VSSCRRCRGHHRHHAAGPGVTGADVEAVKFTQALRGYHTGEVDWVLDRLTGRSDRCAANGHSAGPRRAPASR
jgi:DivIVA domain-containing protein